ncbi:uncharacterized protein [Heptranchias perlo]|uniref:uncharacterized protein n=1 Tax=Heptranchias perlo TaxID=212740 RepID=UPI003559B0A5
MPESMCSPWAFTCVLFLAAVTPSVPVSHSVNTSETVTIPRPSETTATLEDANTSLEVTPSVPVSHSVNTSETVTIPRPSETTATLEDANTSLEVTPSVPVSHSVNTSETVTIPRPSETTATLEDVNTSLEVTPSVPVSHSVNTSETVTIPRPSETTATLEDVNTSLEGTPASPDILFNATTTFPDAFTPPESDGIIGYLLEWRSGASQWNQMNITNTTLRERSLNPGTIYYFRVAAYSDKGRGRFSAEMSVKVPRRRRCQNICPVQGTAGVTEVNAPATFRASGGPKVTQRDDDATSDQNTLSASAISGICLLGILLLLLLAMHFYLKRCKAPIQ